MLVSTTGRSLRRAVLALCLTTIILIHPASAQSANESASFQVAWQQKVVVLKQRLYSIALGTATAGLVVATPDRGVYYEAYFTPPRIADSDVDRLFAKVKAQLNIRGQEAQLLTYEPGTRMVVREVHVAKGMGDTANRRVEIELYDEFAKWSSMGKRLPPTTNLHIEMPAQLSKTLSERQAIETIVRENLELIGPRPKA